MIYLIWSVLNAVLLLYFFYLLIGFIIQGRKVFRGKLMPLSVTVMALGVVHLVSATIPEKNNPEIYIIEDTNKGSETKYKSLVLEDNLALDLGMAVTYSVENRKVIPVETNGDLYGFVLGFDWDLHSFDANQVGENGPIEYTAVGSLKWDLFGFNIYTQGKNFSGKF